MNRMFLIGFCALIAAAIGGGLWVVGGPNHARLITQDADRLAALVDWHNRLRCLGRSQGLPDSLEAAETCPDTVVFEGDLSPFDAVTGAPYVYTRLGGPAFEVCATLALDPQETGRLRADMEMRAGNVVCLAGTAAPDRKG
jgi:hypothetical protein